MMVIFNLPIPGSANPSLHGLVPIAFCRPPAPPFLFPHLSRISLSIDDK